MNGRSVYCNRTYLVQLLLPFFSFLANVFFGVLWTVKSSKFGISEIIQNIWALTSHWSLHIRAHVDTSGRDSRGLFHSQEGIGLRLRVGLKVKNDPIPMGDTKVNMPGGTGFPAQFHYRFLLFHYHFPLLILFSFLFISANRWVVYVGWWSGLV